MLIYIPEIKRCGISKLKFSRFDGFLVQPYMESEGSLEESWMFLVYEGGSTFNKLSSWHSNNSVDWLQKNLRLVQLHQKFGGWDDGYRSTENQIASKPFVWSQGILHFTKFRIEWLWWYL